MLFVPCITVLRSDMGLIVCDRKPGSEGDQGSDWLMRDRRCAAESRKGCLPPFENNLPVSSTRRNDRVRDVSVLAFPQWIRWEEMGSWLVSISRGITAELQSCMVDREEVV